MGISYVESNSNYEIDDIYNSADEALYKSKEKGRSQITTSKLA
jgi:PleD family two-component response regulator